MYYRTSKRLLIESQSAKMRRLNFLNEIINDELYKISFDNLQLKIFRYEANDLKVEIEILESEILEMEDDERIYSEVKDENSKKSI